jgi:biofilm PGA synthesis protein PgaD
MTKRRPSIQAPEGADPVVIINRPELQARWRRTVYSTMTLVAWAVWMYLWLPAITLVAWFLGYRRFVGEIVAPEGGIILRATLVYLIIIGAMGLILFLWSRYNVLRFRGRTRRTAGAPVTDGEMADRLHISPAHLSVLRNADSALIRYGEDGTVLHVGEGARGGGGTPSVR